MKYLENAALENLTNFLTNREMGGVILNGRVEIFSCKRAGEDKKLSKVLDKKIVEDLSVQPPVRERSSSLGDLNEVSTRRLLIDLISTLNASFPDYDFSSVTPEAFSQKELKDVIKEINTKFAELTTTNVTFLSDMWTLIDEVIKINSSEVYSYIPDMEEDPFSDGTMWSFNYFLFNKELKRICYITCLAQSGLYQENLYDDEEDEDMDMEDRDMYEDVDARLSQDSDEM